MDENYWQKHNHQNPINDFYRFVCQRNLWIKIMKSEVNKEAGIRNADKKQPFFDRQIKEFNSRMVAWIETPHSYSGENYIPNDKENCCYDYGRKNSLPPFYILHSPFETIQKRNQKRRNI